MPDRRQCGGAHPGPSGTIPMVRLSAAQVVQFSAALDRHLIEGFVNADHEAVVSLSLQGSKGQSREVDAVIDTGYSGSLTLPPSLVTKL